MFGGLQVVNSKGEVVPMYRWRAVLHTAGTRPFRVLHAFSRFRNRSGLPVWTSMCGRSFPVTTLDQAKPGEGKCFACVNAVSPYDGP